MRKTLQAPAKPLSEVLGKIADYKLSAPRWRTRFAPSPTGYLHAGHAYAVYVLRAVAAQFDAEILIRIEDHDRTRYRKIYEDALLSDLEKLKLLTATTTVYRQSTRLWRYEELFKALQHQQLVYPCTCSRAELRSRTGQSEIYDGFCSQQTSSRPDQDVAWRVRMESRVESWTDLFHGPSSANSAEESGDFVVRTKAGDWSYNFAVCVDDLDQGINLIIRGDDLYTSTSRQLQLRRYLAPNSQAPLYGHHSLILDSTLGVKLSKKNRSARIQDYEAVFISRTISKRI